MYEDLRKTMLLSLFDDLSESMMITSNRLSSIPSSLQDIITAIPSGRHEVLIVTNQLMYFLQYCMHITKTMIVFFFLDLLISLELSINQINLLAMMFIDSYSHSNV